jgi:hypothetical protein
MARVAAGRAGADTLTVNRAAVVVVGPSVGRSKVHEANTATASDSGNARAFRSEYFNNRFISSIFLFYRFVAKARQVVNHVVCVTKVRKILIEIKPLAPSGDRQAVYL